MNLRTRLAAPVLTALLASGLLASCGGDEVSIPTADGDVTVDRDGDELTIETDEGSITSGTGDLPEGFPVDDVPIVDGTIVTGISVAQPEGQGYSVQMTIAATPADIVAEAADLLEGAGFTEESTLSATGVEQRVFASSTWNVSISATEAGDETFVQYIVGPVAAP